MDNKNNRERVKNPRTAGKRGGKYMYKAGKFWLGVLVLIGAVILPCVQAENLHYDPAMASRMVGPYATDDVMRMWQEGFGSSYTVTNNLGMRVLQVNNSGTVVAFSLNNDKATYVYDDENDELVKISHVVYQNNRKLYAYSCVLDEANPENTLMVGNTITVFDDFGNAEFVIKIQQNQPDFARVEDEADALFSIVEQANLAFNIGYDTTGGIFKVSIVGNDTNTYYIEASKAEFLNQVVGYLDIGFMVEKAATLQNLKDGITARLPDGFFTSDQQASRTALKNMINGISGLTINDADLASEDALKAWLNTKFVTDDATARDRMKSIYAGLASSGIITKSTVRGVLRGYCDFSEVYKNNPQDLLVKIDTEEKQKFIETLLVNGISEGNSRMLFCQVGNLFTPEQISANSDLERALGRIDIITRGVGQQLLPAMEHNDIMNLITSMREGNPMIYLDQGGNILTSIDSQDIDLGLTLQDSAFATALVSTVSFSSEELRNPTTMEEKLNRFFGTPEELYARWKSLSAQELADELANSGKGLGAFMTTSIGGDVYLLFGLPPEGLSGVTSANIDRYGKRLYDENRDSILNPLVTAEDFINSRKAYIQNIRNIALKQGIVTGTEGAVAISMATSDAYNDSRFRGLENATGVYDSESIINLVNKLLTGNGNINIQRQELKNSVASWTIKDKETFVRFFDEAVKAAKKGEVSFTYDCDGDGTGETYYFYDAADSLNKTGLVTFGPATDASKQVTFRLTNNSLGTADSNAMISLNEVYNVTTTNPNSSDYQQIENGKWAQVFTYPIFVKCKDWISEGGQFYQTANLAPLATGFTIGGINISGLRGSIVFSAMDVTGSVPVEAIGLNISDTTAGSMIQADPAFATMVTGVYDAQGRALSAQDLTAYINPNSGNNMFSVTANVYVKAEADGGVYIDPRYWSALTEQSKQNYLSTAAQNGGYVTTDVKNWNKVWDTKTDWDFMEEEKIIPITVTAKVDVDLISLQGAEREKAVVQVQNSLTSEKSEDKILSLHGAINAQGDVISALGLGCGPFEQLWVGLIRFQGEID